MKKSYKYLDSEYFTKVFPNNSFVRVKASHPRDFNDPYELFLTIDTTGVNPEILAYYQEIVGQMPELPTVCFSARPDVVPMWAHYAKECSGIVIEFNEGKILEAFPEIRIENVKYSKTPTTIDAHQLTYAHQTSKPRHTFLLQNAAFNAAYFRKSKYWSYEFEKRCVFNEKDITVQNGVRFIELPGNSVSAIIVGPKTKLETAAKVKKMCDKAGYIFFRMHIGRSSMQSFFTDLNNQSFVFNGKKLVQAENSCTVCSEPLDRGVFEKCHWCAIGDEERANAAFRNPMRRLAEIGLLEDYFKRMASS